MKERPILFSGTNVRRILDNLKSQTRRVEKESFERFEEGWSLGGREPRPLREDFCPYGEAGDRLWVRETWQFGDRDMDSIYKADNATLPLDWMRWYSPIFMPRERSRITLEITDVRVERLQEITEADAIAEGVLRLSAGLASTGEYVAGTSQQCFAKGSDKLNSKRGYSWESNPLVWVLSFKRI